MIPPAGDLCVSPTNELRFEDPKKRQWDMRVELEFGVLFVIAVLGQSTFAVFEVETPAWRKITKSLVVRAATLALYTLVGHWSLLVPTGATAAGGTFHIVWCRRHGIHPIRATPRRRYYELRGWEWPQ